MLAAFLAGLLLVQAPPTQLYVQARVADSMGVPLNGPLSITVSIYDVESGGVALWSEISPALALNGVVTLQLGSVSSIPPNLFDAPARYLGLKIGADPEMTPRRPMLSVPFAARAGSVAALSATTSIPSGLITSAHVLDGAIATADLADNAVTGAKLAIGSIGTPQIVDGAVTSTKIADGQVTALDLGNAAVTSAKLANDSVDGSKILDGAIGSADLATNAVTATKIADNSVGSSKLQSPCLNTSHFQIGCVPSYAIPDGAISSAKLATGAVLLTNMATNSVDGSKVVLQSIDADSLASPMTGDGFVPFGVLSARANASNFTSIGITGESQGPGGGTGIVGRATHPTAALSRGVEGNAASTNGVGVYGSAASTTGTTYGVRGQSSSTSGTGMLGVAVASTGSTVGVEGSVNSTSGIGVQGNASAASGSTVGVNGTASSNVGIGVRGDAHTGVYGFSSDSSGDAVHGSATALTGAAWGVRADSASTSGRGVSASALAFSGVTYGVYGSTASPSGFGVFAQGGFGGTGAKYFLQPHPSDPSKEIRFVCLEGNESGTYFRGSARLVGGRAVIDVPEDFRLVSEASGLTVQLTPIGELARLCVESQSLDRVVVKGDMDVEFSYFVNGLRRGFAEHRTIHDNSSFVPETRGVPYGTQYPEAYRRILVENGILNPDFTPNETTAARLGWTLRAPGAAR